ncbi:XRE family transcriptional regulator [Actinomadura rubrisoli]|uniref:XRE family transcriptional regulator n=1 Tax=Actinomadura rubrisoli TaxID=2530368 RepID=A0A4R5ATE5_9ACTN|nr:XRE family transcriptional regulator [Actinomadura rubrisoli]
MPLARAPVSHHGSHEEQRDRGRAARDAGISLDTLRNIERGAIAVPAFSTVASLARVLDLGLTALARTLEDFDDPAAELAG